jgi:hypothetical protein
MKKTICTLPKINVGWRQRVSRKNISSGLLGPVVLCDVVYSIPLSPNIKKNSGERRIE